MTDRAQYDLLVIGGGINGCGIARDAAGRGLSVLLVEQSDLASATSSASTKLFHGGLRYLEYYEFRLVREALRERETLLRNMPHISWPLRFVLPHHSGLRPAWLLRLGLAIYDHMGGRKILPPTRVLDLAQDPAGTPLKKDFRKAFEYSDCWVEDSRLVVLNARDAADRGAEIRTRCTCVGATAGTDGWEVDLQSAEGSKETVHARAIVNAAGPWVDQVLKGTLGQATPDRIRLVRGSHIVTRKLFDHDRPYIFQQSDGRIIFAIPYEGEFTLIGTTDADHDGPPDAAVCTPEEQDYLCAAASEYFAKPVTRSDIVWTYSGVRPLYDDGASSATAATRDYVLKLIGGDGADGPAAPLLSVFGGKITTYRKLAEAAVAKLERVFGPLPAGWTADAPLPGGDFPVDGFDALVAGLQADYPFLPPALARRLARAYGTCARALLGDASDMAALGADFGAGLTEAEIRYLMAREWARSAEDVIWRRSKLGLRLDGDQILRLQDWMDQNRA
ncbi:glycerol-3-phosphate dehydrogenase [Oceanomicrobium pacificus]|uniref:Glycerol-3-phosphate dehydrogenase n=1 Tax=Oceanomicrobium pacificus TaxID=2692916 RepID=A0A6B0TY19_9RHOB|nr:glycerol-3-phosphate dehydrogenase [Oceanomicrobium pacificus]MXU66605.1 glycerol-3-phosphate dehydrogenase [Oceanomicrobium pacificus]